jgi:DDE family transposase
VAWYPRVRAAVAAALPFLAPTQAANLALLVSALLARRTLCLTELARAYPTPATRRVPAPKHDLLHRLKRLWRFLGNERVDPLAVQAALIPHAVARLARGGRLGLAIDWTLFDAALPSGRVVRYQVLRVAVPCRGRAVPLLQVAYDRDRLPADSGQNQLEEAALWAVVAALPAGTRPVVLADRGFARAPFLAALQGRGLDFVVRVKKGTWLTEADGRRWKLGEEGLARGQVRWAPGVRYALPRDGRPGPRLNVALCWRVARGRRGRKPAGEPWYLATSLGSAGRAVCWYWRRGWIEQSFRDAKHRFGLDRVRVGCPLRLSRLLAALTLAAAWLALAALPELGAMPVGWRAHVAQWAAVSLLTLALAFLDERGDLPAAALPHPPG